MDYIEKLFKELREEYERKIQELLHDLWEKHNEHPPHNPD